MTYFCDIFYNINQNKKLKCSIVQNNVGKQMCFYFENFELTIMVSSVPLDSGNGKNSP